MPTGWIISVSIYIIFLKLINFATLTQSAKNMN